jgi:ABC-type sugar transport system substrate-binding protein
MKTLTTMVGTLLLGMLVTAAAQTPQVQPAVHRYVIERTFPAGALEGLDAAAKAKVNANNSKFGVRWVMSYANAAKTKTYCVYEGPDEAAIRHAATANKLPVDSITEVPLTLMPR